MKNLFVSVVGTILAFALVAFAVVFSVSICFAVAFMVCSLVNFFVGYELFGMASIAGLAVCLFLIGRLK